MSSGSGRASSRDLSPAPCDKFEPLFLSESSLSGQNMSLRGWPLLANLSNVRPVSVQVLKKQKKKKS